MSRYSLRGLSFLAKERRFSTIFLTLSAELCITSMNFCLLSASVSGAAMSIWEYPSMGVSGLLISCAMLDTSCPKEASFSF